MASPKKILGYAFLAGAGYFGLMLAQGKKIEPPQLPFFGGIGAGSKLGEQAAASPDALGFSGFGFPSPLSPSTTESGLSGLWERSLSDTGTSLGAGTGIKKAPQLGGDLGGSVGAGIPKAETPKKITERSSIFASITKSPIPAAKELLAGRRAPIRVEDIKKKAAERPSIFRSIF